MLIIGGLRSIRNPPFKWIYDAKSRIHRTKLFLNMKRISQIEAMKSVRKHTIFVGKPYGTPKGLRGYNRKKQKQKWRKEI